MKQTQFERTYGPQWQLFSGYLERLESGGKRQKGKRQPGLNAQEYTEFSRLYRQVCHYHALARDRQYSSYLVDRLESLVARGHQQFYRRNTHFVRKIIAFLVAEFPQLVRREQKYVWTACALLYLPAVGIFLSILWRPDLVFTVVGPAEVRDFEAMYNPANRVLGSARDADTNWHMFGFYINNNISVAFRTFATGLVVGVGSVFFLVFNGLLLGAVAGHLTEVGFSHTFFSFVIGHGSFELTAIAIAGAAGLRLGYGLLAPGQHTRLESLKLGAGVAIRLMYGVIFLLVLAAFVEAFWSSSNMLSFHHKYIAGGFLWLMVIVYLVRGGRRGSH